ncbi:MAG: TonB-dependent receptor [Opitutales bacterium]|nr:TonB-dependent receptor [Opitutales bacterium]
MNILFPSARHAALFALPLLASSNINAQSLTYPLKHGDIEELEPFVITANRVRMDKVNVVQSIDVIDGLVLNSLDGVYATDLLKKTTSVDVIEYPGGTSGVSLRGFRPQYSNETNPYTLILVNGHPVSASMGNIPSVNIERIEVLKGPASAIYGPSAMGGVVNIITKKSKGDVSGSAYASYGSYDESKAGLSVGGSLTDKFSFDAAVAFTDRGESYRVGDGDAYEVGSDGGDRYQNTEFTRTDWSGRLGYQLNQVWSADLYFNGSIQNNIGVPGALSNQQFHASNYSNRDMQRYDLSLDISGKYETQTLSAQIYLNQLDALQTYADDCYSSSYNGRTNDTDITEHGIQLQDFWEITEHNDLTFGIDYNNQEEDYLSKNADGSVRTYYRPNSEREKMGIYMESINRFVDDRLILTAGGRFDEIDTTVDSSTYEGTSYMYQGGKVDFDHFSPRAGLVWKFSDQWRLHASAGTAFITPDAEQLAGFYESFYSTYTKGSYGNPDLDPESSVTYDLGLEYNGKYFNLDVTLFSTDVDDKITNINTGELDAEGRRKYLYVNADTQEMQGVEFVSSIDVGRTFGMHPNIWNIEANWTYMDKAETWVDGSLEAVKNIAKWKGNISLAYRGINLWSRLTARYNGHRWDIDYTFDDYYGGDWYEYPDYWVFDWSVGYHFLSNHEISLTVGNILDEYYYEKLDYPLEGRHFSVKYTYEF